MKIRWMCCRKDFMEQVLSAVSDHFAQVTGLKQDLIRIVNSGGANVMSLNQAREAHKKGCRFVSQVGFS